MNRRLFVLGNCQAIVLGDCLRNLCPDLQVASVLWWSLTLPAANELARTFTDSDIVVSQFSEAEALGDLRASVLGVRSSFGLYPSIHFTGFHPDALRVDKQLGLWSPIGAWHSLLVLAAFVLGVPERRVAELFNAYIYSALGYFDEYEKACRFNERKSTQIGWRFEYWKREGLFVHVPNHPTVGLLWSIAQILCERLALPTDPDARMPDDGLIHHSKWPVYPELARRLNVESSLVFRPPADKPGLAIDELIHWFYGTYSVRRFESAAIPRLVETVQTLKRAGV